MRLVFAGFLMALVISACARTAPGAHETKAQPFKRKTYVYMGVGSWEEQPERSYAMVSDMNAFAAALAAHE